ncbi:MAG: hypothetical protein KAR19_10085 [Bacteroidales bacterium]|nr:hypothetical protein [Bacteroidales bacterium]
MKFSIISSVWFVVFTGAMIGLIFVTLINNTIKSVLKKVEILDSDEEKKEILESIKEDQNRFLRFGMQGILALAASIGISMSILFQGGAGKWEDQTVIICSMNMVLAFSLILFGFLAWIVKPYLRSFMMVRYYYRRYPDNIT